MSTYMNRAFRQSNSSMLLSRGKAIQCGILRLGGKQFLVDSGLGAARVCTQDELIGVPKAADGNGFATRFENKVGYGSLVAGADSSPPIRTKLLERFLVDIVTGESAVKERAAARFSSMVGSTNRRIVLPRGFRHERAWMELEKIWRTSKKVKGFVLEKIQRGPRNRRSYAVGIAGYIAFLQTMPISDTRRKISSAEFTISSIKPKRKNIVVFMSGGGMNLRGMRGRKMGKIISVSSSAQHEVEELCWTTEKAFKKEEKHLKEEDGTIENEEVIYKTQVPANRCDWLSLEGVAQFLRIFVGVNPIPSITVASKESMPKMHLEPEICEVGDVTLLDDLKDVTNGQRPAALHYGANSWFKVLGNFHFSRMRSFV